MRRRGGWTGRGSPRCGTRRTPAWGCRWVPHNVYFFLFFIRSIGPIGPWVCLPFLRHETARHSCAALVVSGIHLKNCECFSRIECDAYFHEKFLLDDTFSDENMISIGYYPIFPLITLKILIDVSARLRLPSSRNRTIESNEMMHPIYQRRKEGEK